MENFQNSNFALFFGTNNEHALFQIASVKNSHNIITKATILCLARILQVNLIPDKFNLISYLRNTCGKNYFGYPVY